MTRPAPRLRIAQLVLLALSMALLVGQSGTRGLAVVSGAKRLQDVPNNKGKRYAICIGVSGYEDPAIQDLVKARNDAKALGEAFKDNGQFDSIFVMTDDVDPRYDAAKVYPRLANIRARLQYLKDFITPNDLVVLSFSGHGIANDKGEGYLLPADARAQDPFASSLPVSEIVDWLKKLKVKKSLLLLDACREKVTESASRGLANANLRSDQYDRAELSAIFYATKTGWFSYEDAQSDYGVFTRFLLDGIKGKADYQYGNRDGLVTFKELAGFVEDAVSTYALGLGLKQRPSTQINGESFGDLAISTYSATIDTATRSVAISSTAGGSAAAGSGHGSASIYSNVAGQIQLDGKPSGSIAQGALLTLNDIPAGSHFVEIDHPFGVLKKELIVADKTLTSIMNIVIRNDREPRTVHGVTLLHIAGGGSLPGFWIGESEVTFGQFAQFVQETGYAAQGSWRDYYKPAYDWYPVFHVTWDDCMAYARWLSQSAGSAVTLPTLAQWKYAAGEKNSTVYPWGNDWNPGYCQDADSTAHGALPVVGANGPVQVQHFVMDLTLDGVAQMAGNVREWCGDQKTASDTGSLLAAAAGGSWRLSKPKYFASDYFTWKPASAEEEDLGFRVAMQGD